MPAGRTSRTGRIRSEFDLIRRLQARTARPDRQVIHGIGDDTAVLRTSSSEWTLMTTDLLTEGIHFDPTTSSYDEIGYRAAAANLSDIAAMGGRPRFLLVALAIPPTCTSTQIERLYRGMMRALRPYDVALIGGDTSASQQGLFLSLTLTGVVKPNRLLLRSAARVGDRLYVTGTLGDARAGLGLLMARTRKRLPALRPAHRNRLLARHHRPTARVAEGLWLVRHGFSRAAIDLSDGLTGDLRHLCRESGVGAVVDAAALPLSPACRAYAAATGQDAVDLALQGGEDYELLFTVPASLQRRFERAAAADQLRFTAIGVVTDPEEGLRLKSSDGRIGSLPLTSYEHFLRPA